MMHHEQPPPVNRSALKRRGRPREWTPPRARRRTRLYCYTSLKVDEILKVLEDDVWEPGKEAANKKINHLLGKDPRWMRPRDISEARRRMANLKSSDRARSSSQSSLNTLYVDEERAYRQTLESQKAVLSTNHPGTPTIMSNSELALKSQAKYEGTDEIDHRIGGAGAASNATFHDSGIGTSVGQEGSGKSKTTTEDFLHHESKDDEMDDSYERATTYSTVTTKSMDDRNQKYKKTLAAWLCHDLLLSNTEISNIAKLSGSLPHLLQIFALKIGKEKNDGASQDAMRFIMKHRRSIAHQFETKAQALSSSIHETSQGVPETRDDESAAMKYVEKIERWIAEIDNIHDPNLPLDSEGQEKEPVFDMLDEVLDMEEDSILEFVTGSRAYQWLFTKLWNELEIGIPTATAFPKLSEAILGKYKELHPFSRKSPPQRIDIVFEMEWSPHSFLKEQEYGISPEEAVVKAFVLVGTATQAEGMACGEYLLRQWPESATAFIRLIQSVVKSAEGTSHYEKLSDDTSTQASVKDGYFTLKACGHPDSVIEIGEQLMWISCALRSSDFTGIGICEPSFQEITTANRSEAYVSMHIKLAATPKLAQLSEFENGACWQGLFHNSLVVGYPILSRSSGSALGLQLSLNTLLGLVQNSRLVSYMGKLFIKSFSTLLVAVELVDDVILWHAVFNKDGSYIYYHDKRVDVHGVAVTSSLMQQVDMTKLKHIVGWTSTADNLAGTPGGNYEVRLSGLANSRPLEIELEKFTVGFSKVFSGNVSVKFGWRDKPIHTRDGDDFKLNIKHISKHFVVLYDVGDHRGFLLDGATALLHLVRASIVEDQEAGLIESLCHDRTINDSIQLDNDPDPRRRAMKALWKDDNACLRLYKRLVAGGTKTEVKTTFEIP